MHYLEHRAYLVGCGFKPSSGSPKEIQLNLAEASDMFGKGAHADVSRIIAPGDQYTQDPPDLSCLEIRLNDEGFKGFKKAFDVIEDATLVGVRIILSDLGFLNIYTMFDVPDHVSPDRAEPLSCDLLTVHDSFFSFYTSLCAILGRLKVIVLSNVFHFGTHPVLKLVDEWNPETDYYVDSHFIRAPSGDTSSWVDYFHLTANPFRVEDFDFHPGWACHLWVGPETVVLDEMVINLHPCRYLLELCVAYDTATSCYTGFLCLVQNKPAKVNPALVNRIVAANNFIIQKLRLAKAGLTEAQFALVGQMAGPSELDSRIDLFRDSERALTSAVAGIHAWTLRKSSNAIRFLLNTFAVLSLYSIAYSVICLMNLDEIPHLQIDSSAGHTFTVISLLIVVAVLYSALTVYRSEGKRL